MESRIEHVNVMVDDLGAAIVFYRDVLGLEPLDPPNLGFPAMFFRLNTEQTIHVNELADVKPARAHFCVRVADFNAAFRMMVKLDVLEIETWGRPRLLPGGVMQMFVRDPAGNLIEVASEPDAVIDDDVIGHELMLPESVQ